MTSFDRIGINAGCVHDAAYKAQAQKGANLEAADLTKSDLSGASLKGAQLQGSRLANAALDGADLSGTFLWRADFGAPAAAASPPRHLQMANEVWAPRQGDSTPKPWNEDAYDRVMLALGGIVPADDMPDIVPKRLRRLDCKDTSRAKCDTTATDAAPTARAALEKDVSEEAALAASLLATTRSLVCSGDGNAVYVLRGLMANGRLDAVARHGTKILTDILDESPQSECLVHAQLSDDDKTKLRGLKRRLAATGIGD